VAEVEPCGILTLRSTLATAGLEMKSDTVTPPVPAAVIRVTVPMPNWPPTMVLGLTETLSAADGGLTVRPNVLLAPE
jgi:hypothetical protein